MNSKLFNEIFQKCINDYHIHDNIDFACQNPYKEECLERLLYKKCWIDTVQWHLEDIIRDPNIEPEHALKIKRRIDLSNQDRTDLVEDIDEFVFQKFNEIAPKKSARINTETPAWAIDRLSILNLKVFHMNEETLRRDASQEHLVACNNKLNTLQTQYRVLSNSISTFLTDIKNGDCIATTYKQMKMYNDPELNPVLRNIK